MKRVVLPYFAVMALAGSAASATENESLEMLRSDKLAAAKQRYEAVEAGWMAGVNPESELYAASRDWKDAERDVAKAKTERIRALESHLDRMDTLYKKSHELATKNKKGGEADKDAAAHFWAVQAKVWLIEEKGKP